MLNIERMLIGRRLLTIERKQLTSGQSRDSGAITVP
jgi:hypothetical protein